MNPVLFDTHAHLEEEGFDADRADVIGRAVQSGVRRILCAGVNADSSQKALSIASSHKIIFASAGIQPGYAGSAGVQDWEAIRRLACHPKVVAIGETGLDLHYDRSDPARQREMFEMHLQLALELGKPVIVHCRKAADIVGEILQSTGSGIRGVQHCFSEDVTYARKLLGLGFYVSFSGIITRQGYKRLKEAVRVIPMDRLLVETDCPYMLPLGPAAPTNRNEPSYIRFTLDALARLRGEDPVELACRTTENACRLFGIQNISSEDS